MCQSELTEFFAELTEFAAELSEFSLPKQYSRNSIPPVAYNSRAHKPWSANCELKHWNFRGWKCLIHGCASWFSPSLIHGLCALFVPNSRFMRLVQAALDTPLDSPVSATLSVHGLHFTVCAHSINAQSWLFYREMDCPAQWSLATTSALESQSRASQGSVVANPICKCRCHKAGHLQVRVAVGRRSTCILKEAPLNKGPLGLPQGVICLLISSWPHLIRCAIPSLFLLIKTGSFLGFCAPKLPEIA